MKNKFPTKEIIDLINTGTTEKKKENDEKNASKTQTQDQSGFGAEEKSLYDSLDKINADYEKTDVRFVSSSPFCSQKASGSGSPVATSAIVGMMLSIDVTASGNEIVSAGQKPPQSMERW